MTRDVPAERIRAVNDRPVRPDGEFVVYWMIASRRVHSNHALDRAVALARAHGKPLVVLEALRAGYPYASDRLHAFVLQGMAENARRLAGRTVTYHPYVERTSGEGKGLLEALGARACVVVTDDFPTFFLPRMVASAGEKLPVRLEAVDGCGLVPFRLAGRDFPTAYAFRRWLQRVLPAWLERAPSADPLSRAPLPRLERLPTAIARRWPVADPDALAAPARLVASLPIDHAVPIVEDVPGGSAAGERRVRAFLDERLPRYAEDRSSPDAGATSGLSPYLHFGRVSSEAIVRAILDRERWNPGLLAPKPTGARAGFWGLSPGAEAFLDQLVTWRELGFVTAAHRPDHAEYGSLPAWARATLAKHARDPRPVRYGLDRLAAGETGDPVWNAAQRQLLADGTIHNALRMIWGKRLLEWTEAPEEALARLVHLNDRFALDGRDPNSYSGICWCFGRYDRPWGPERAVYGTVRYMSSTRLGQKVALARTLARYARPEAVDRDGPGFE
jgi:deoxyribodipyrimidine photo-lyase